MSLVNKERVKQNFSKSAQHYDIYADVQTEIADKFLQSLQINDLKIEKILDIGCGTGYLANKLAEKFPNAKVCGIDFADGMIECAKISGKKSNLSFILGDGEEMVFPDNSFDLVVSTSSLHWMDLEKVFKEVNRILKNNGSFSFHIFGEKTFQELRQIFGKNKILSFINSSALKEQLIRNDFRIINFDREINRKYFDSPLSVLRSLKNIGGNNPPEVFPVLKGKNGFLRKMKEFDSKFRTKKGLGITYEDIFVGCFKCRGDLSAIGGSASG